MTEYNGQGIERITSNLALMLKESVLQVDGSVLYINLEKTRNWCLCSLIGELTVPSLQKAIVLLKETFHSDTVVIISPRLDEMIHSLVSVGANSKFQDLPEYAGDKCNLAVTIEGLGMEWRSKK